MPFDPGRSGGNNYNYSNPYAPQTTAPPKKSGLNLLIFVIIGLLITGCMVGAYLFASKNKTQLHSGNASGDSVVNKSEYIEVEIFDVDTTK